MNVKGEKRFKVKEASVEPKKTGLLDFRTQDYSWKKEQFRKMNYITHYSITFGERPKMKED